jgi:hypothetical protein
LFDPIEFGRTSEVPNRASQVLDTLFDAPVLAVEPGSPIDVRTSYGICGEGDDLAFSIEWRDVEGCAWAADFSEGALAQAEIRNGAIALRDTGGAEVVLRLYLPTGHLMLSERGNR